MRKVFIGLAVVAIAVIAIRKFAPGFGERIMRRRREMDEAGHEEDSLQNVRHDLEEQDGALALTSG